MSETTSLGDLAGQTLAGDRYQITAKLGQGGMGYVYQAHDRNLKTDVVIKVPRQSLLQEDPDFARRFALEVRSLVQLMHPHIVRVIDVGTREDVPFLVLQYLPGGSLADQRPCDEHGHPVPGNLADLRGYLPDVAEALDFMHSQGYLHRDVKPGNILFDAHGNVYLSDFGLAKALQSPRESQRMTSLTGTGQVLGTPPYMAPELILGKPYDGRVDQYALAVMAYELLAGRLPFDGPSASAFLVQHTTETPRPLHELRPELDRAASDAVQKALAKKPEVRFPNCRTFVRALLGKAGDAAETLPRPVRKPAPKDAGTTAKVGMTACPDCGGTFALPTGLEPGTRLRCPKCRSVFASPAPKPAGKKPPAGLPTVETQPGTKGKAVTQPIRPGLPPSGSWPEFPDSTREQEFEDAEAPMPPRRPAPETARRTSPEQSRRTAREEHPRTVRVEHPRTALEQPPRQGSGMLLVSISAVVLMALVAGLAVWAVSQRLGGLGGDRGTRFGIGSSGDSSSRPVSLHLEPIKPVVLEVGKTTRLRVQVKHEGGDGKIDLQITRLPARVRVSGATAVSADGVAEVLLAAAPDAEPGQREVEVEARHGNLVETQRVRLTVARPAGLRLTVPDKVVIDAGDSKSFDIGVTRQRVQGDVTLKIQLLKATKVQIKGAPAGQKSWTTTVPASKDKATVTLEADYDADPAEAVELQVTALLDSHESEATISVQIDDLFKPFTPKDRSFRVELPGKPKKSTEKYTSATDDRTTLETIYLLQAAKPTLAIYSISYVEGDIQKGTDDVVLHKEQEKLAKRPFFKNYTKIREERIKLDGYAGREIFGWAMPFEAKRRIYTRVRMYVARPRVYFVIMIASKEVISSRIAEKYFKSFAITAKPEEQN